MNKMESDTIIYIRTSTEEQEPENQIESCERLINKKDYILLQDKQSAFKDNVERESFEKAKQLIKSGKIKHFVVWDLDRIYRNRIKLKQFFEFCKLYKCEIHSVRQQWLEQIHNIPEPFNEIMHELLLNLMGWMAEDESRKKSERVKLAIRKTKDGITVSYRGKKWGRKSLKVAGDIIKLYEQGKTMRQITKEVYYWDKNNHKKYVSLGFVHKIISQYRAQKTSQEDTSKKV